MHADKFRRVRSLYAQVLVQITVLTCSAYTRALLESFYDTDLVSSRMLAHAQNEKRVMSSTCYMCVLSSFN